MNKDLDDFLDDLDSSELFSDDIGDLSDHFRSFSFQAVNDKATTASDIDDIISFLAACDIKCDGLSNDEIVNVYNDLLDGTEEPSEDDDTISFGDMDQFDGGSGEAYYED